jgi:histidyl-tRNA synthetase
MTEEKGLDPAVADKIGEYVNFKGSRDLLEKLASDPVLTADESAKKGIEDMKLLFNYLEAFDVLDSISLDMSLARGLDYYTGVIYEVITEGSAPPAATVAAATSDGHPPRQSGRKEKKKSDDQDEDRSNDPSVGVGSIAAGGRYDELVGMFSGKGQIPCVGISFGVDRIFSITKARMQKECNCSATDRGRCFCHGIWWKGVHWAFARTHGNCQRTLGCRNQSRVFMEGQAEGKISHYYYHRAELTCIVAAAVQASRNWRYTICHHSW